MKILRLGATALAVAVLLSGYLYFFESERWRFTNVCFTRAPSLAACVCEDFDFTADFFGMSYYGAFERPSLFLLRDLMRAVAGNTGTLIDIGANTGHHSLYMSRAIRA